MILDNSLEQLFQQQLNRERFNAATYDNLAGVLETIPWDGFAKWMRNAAAEELLHYKRFNDFLVDRNCIPTIDETPFPSRIIQKLPRDYFVAAMNLEKDNTAKIQEISDACDSVGDQDAQNWLIWALEEQRNAERELTDILNQLQLAGDNYAALLQLDHQLGEG
jgi:ferritin